MHGGTRYGMSLFLKTVADLDTFATLEDWHDLELYPPMWALVTVPAGVVATDIADFLLFIPTPEEWLAYSVKYLDGDQCLFDIRENGLIVRCNLTANEDTILQVDV